ncbi:hypothetical protein OL548_03095 [Lysinibacillus sp. MHQ-1]|nr:hypothetical protein OL548_03095 [Lysinibacillus sp. MHQ-1]
MKSYRKWKALLNTALTGLIVFSGIASASAATPALKEQEVQQARTTTETLEDWKKMDE